MKTMSVSIDEELYRSLKASAGPRGMSRFIAEAVQAKLSAQRDTLHEAYLEAARDQKRESEAAEWSATETEGWD